MNAADLYYQCLTYDDGSIRSWWKCSSSAATKRRFESRPNKGSERPDRTTRRERPASRSHWRLASARLRTGRQRRPVGNAATPGRPRERGHRGFSCPVRPRAGSRLRI